jgi:hypothetical protein
MKDKRMLELAGIDESQMDFGFKDTDEKYKKLAQKYANIVKTYAVKVGSNPKSLQDFIHDMEPEKAAFPYSVSSVERNMFVAGTKAEALEAGLDPEEPAIKAVIQKKLEKTPYTNWSGD